MARYIFQRFQLWIKNKMNDKIGMTMHMNRLCIIWSNENRCIKMKGIIYVHVYSMHFDIIYKMSNQEEIKNL